MEYVQGRVLTVGNSSSGSGLTEGVGVGVIHCGDGVSELQPAQPRQHSHYTVKLVSPAGATIDNPSRVRRELPFDSF
ncbi:hypothetical protein E2C01_006829 [Portunus trituberculatus]|uniref:Uncharacterized protein n=1 Tax=Portunus trituberculatus TaxID=210409 RepID=A0A5B7CW61_PORTR|nr:hypothetical protein [Portunus trituberculatus]